MAGKYIRKIYDIFFFRIQLKIIYDFRSCTNVLFVSRNFPNTCIDRACKMNEQIYKENMDFPYVIM